MLTLILNGSPRPSGDTAHMIAALRETLSGDVEEISAYRANIKPCVDCRWCRTHPGCAIQDDMQRVYALLERADCVVIASPVYFSELTGRMLDIASRLQLYYSYKRFSGQALPMKKSKRGAVLLAGGGDGSADRAEATARLLLKCMGARDIRCASSLNTDEVSATRDAAALEQARQLGRWLSDPE